MLVIGAGNTGVQVASIFHAFGTSVQLFEAGPVVTCVGIGWRVFGRHEGIRSCGEVNDLIVWFLGEGVPSVDLAHDDLS